ncbi:alpha/beta hydrolase [Longispora fulva]|uniref:Acetyl esterase/lipase n=1 Tax=Longispora fulva TaxID=619741 RepID=A0A8J7GGJ3_9ACTN|nr:alpha/beta hydrolase [Longispora fulva]MBG6136297.1 acetyl esterase/lipase [Longispora fulva]
MKLDAVLLWVHGGGWQHVDNVDVSVFERLGMTVKHAKYRLAPHHVWPAQLDDVRAEARAAREAGKPLVLAGNSSGAHLALHVGLRGVDEPGDVAAVLAFQAPVDPVSPDWPQPLGPRSSWTKLLGRVPAADDPETIASGVLPHVGGSTPVLVVHAFDDAIIPPSQAVRLADALIAAGHPTHVTITDGGHTDFDPGRADIAGTIARFLSVRLGGTN